MRNIFGERVLAPQLGHRCETVVFVTRLVRWMALGLGLALLATGCGPGTSDGQVAGSDIAPVAPAGAAATAVPVSNGRTAIAEAQGTAHILWFWGAL